jgi:hypothetical protein
MIGTAETLRAALKTGKSQKGHGSLWPLPGHVSNSVPFATIREYFQGSDESLLITLEEAALLTEQKDHTSPLLLNTNCTIMNFIYALDVPIPQSWANQWKFARELERNHYEIATHLLRHQ